MDPENTSESQLINKKQLGSILANFGYSHYNAKEINKEIGSIFPEKKRFTLRETLSAIADIWYNERGRENEIEDIYRIFDKK